MGRTWQQIEDSLFWGVCHAISDSTGYLRAKGYKSFKLGVADKLLIRRIIRTQRDYYSGVERKGQIWDYSSRAYLFGAELAEFCFYPIFSLDLNVMRRRSIAYREYDPKPSD